MAAQEGMRQLNTTAPHAACPQVSSLPVCAAQLVSRARHANNTITQRLTGDMC